MQTLFFRLVFIAFYFFYSTVQAESVGARMRIASSTPPIYSLVSSVANGSSHQMALILSTDKEAEALQLRDLNHVRFSRLMFYYDGKYDAFIYRIRKAFRGAKKIKLAKVAKIWRYKRDIKPLSYAWLDPVEAIHITKAIKNELIKVDPGRSKIYINNFVNLSRRMKAISVTIKKELKDVLFGKRKILFIGSDLKYFARHFKLPYKMIPEFSAAVVRRFYHKNKDSCIIDTTKIKVKDRRYITENVGAKLLILHIDQIAPIKQKYDPIMLDNYYFYNLRYISNSIVGCFE